MASMQAWQHLLISRQLVTAAQARATGHRGLSRTRARPLTVLNSEPAMAQMMGATNCGAALPTDNLCCEMLTAGV